MMAMLDNLRDKFAKRTEHDLPGKSVALKK